MYRQYSIISSTTIVKYQVYQYMQWHVKYDLWIIYVMNCLNG
jgi:hypothetical protein